MSNNLVGTIYQQIINEVIEASRVDFEDQGVGEDVLDELRRVRSFPPFLVSKRPLPPALCQFIMLSKSHFPFYALKFDVMLVVDGPLSPSMLAALAGLTAALKLGRVADGERGNAARQELTGG